ncbi:kinesin-like protein KIN-1 [Selaginella moellendorffii]|uniref:kinesin-like protein KIN-1 n=1 Tax=Selaginella moellendorffii TaxID=88036 RepID=UPI000D1C8B3E|nr:kinesin-like protein KIN-1 [Selaginella moellendorffii]|eukprot:XP_024531534.1 kinesin-like protein KIN-1 [Selaginella moellendorffii]
MSSVSVCVRFRPCNSREIASTGAKSSIHILDDRSFDFKDDKEGAIGFSFDRVFNEGSPQGDVFDFVALPIVQDAMNAINGTVLAYGQTGAGKTFSMEGTDDPGQEGILPRVARWIFQYIETADPVYEFIIKLSMVEIYLERIRDLLDSTKDNLQVKEDKTRGIFVAGASEVYLQSEEEMLKTVKAGILNRAVGATNMNANSSRSHCVFLITIQQTNSEDRSVKTGKLFLVDLAGSEKVEKTCTEGKLLTEAKTINKSLSALGNVINALTCEKACHVPYRDSKLTRILQESLGGNSRTTLLCCCSSGSYNAAETLSTLRFGLRAKEIKNKPRVNTERSRHDLEQALLKAEGECERLRSQVIMLNARIHSLTGEDNPAAKLAVGREANSGMLEKLKVALSKKTPNLDDVVEIVRQLFEEEGLLGDFSEVPDADLTAVLNEEMRRTLTVMQNTVDEIAEILEKLPGKSEVPECRCGGRKAPDTLKAACVRRAQIIRPVRGGTHGARESTWNQNNKLATESLMDSAGNVLQRLMIGWWKWPTMPLLRARDKSTTLF